MLGAEVAFTHTLAVLLVIAVWVIAFCYVLGLFTGYRRPRG